MKRLSLFLISLVPAFAFAANWPQWRGPEGTGVAAETEFPVKWTKTENILWRVPLPDRGNSTPIVWNDRVFITQQFENGARRAVMCFDRKNGNVLWQKDVPFTGKEPTHGDNPYCSASP